LPVANGGTGQTSYTDGQLLIGNSTGNTLTKATLTAGTNVTITNAAGAITIAASGGGSSQWITDGSNIYYSAGNVGLKTTTFSSITGSAATLSLGGTSTSTSGGIVYQVNGTAKGAHYIDSDVMNHQSVSAGHKFLASNVTPVLEIAKDLSVALQGATSQSGTGITFPATQSASSNANTLDDYEEGTFTPTLPSGSTGVSYTTQAGKYTKIGNVVYIHIAITISGVSSVPGGGGANIIEGLPFTGVSGGANYASFVTKWNGCNFGGTVGVAQITPNAAAISAVSCTNNAGFTDSVPSSVWDSGGNWITVTGHYYVS
jgi:hypothetical protein